MYKTTLKLAGYGPFLFREGQANYLLGRVHQIDEDTSFQSWQFGYNEVSGRVHRYDVRQMKSSAEFASCSLFTITLAWINS